MIREDLAATADALSAPLGQNKRSRRRFELVLSLPQLLLGGMGLLVAAAGVAAIIEYSPWGARLVALATVKVPSGEASKKPEPVAAVPETLAAAPIALENTSVDPVRSAPPPVKTITIIDGSSGKRQEIVIPEAPEKNAELGEAAELPRPIRNARPLPRPPR